MRRILIPCLGSLALAVGCARPALAENARPATDAGGLWQNECSSCHIAYPPQYLSRSGWRHVMGQLDKHFGSDASLAPAETRTIAAHLDRLAATDESRFGAASGRITETRWFARTHDEVPRNAFSANEVKRAANCQACHGNAAKGRFGEHELTAVGRRYED